MKNSLLFLPKWRLLIILVLMLGIFFRFINLDRKIYWFDETYTSLRASGYTEEEVTQKLYDGSVIRVEDLLKYQRTNSEKNLTHTIQSLAKEEPQHSPLYYVLTKFWMQCFGNSIAVTRSLSAFINLLAFPCIYWLCWELFESSKVGWIAVCLLAISPFHVLYAQEARPYSLWVVTILLSSAALLQAIRRKDKVGWGLYTATLALSLYTFTFSALVALGHGIYVVLVERLRLTKVLASYLISSLVGFLLFLPWILVLINGFFRVKATTSQLTEKISPLSFIKAWLGRIGYVFVDLNPYSPNPKLTAILFLQYVLGLLILGIIFYALYFIVIQSPKRIWLFILTLIGGAFLTLLLADLILGGSRSIVNRYLIPCFIGIQIAVAYLLANQDDSTVIKFQRQKQRFWNLITVFIFSCGVLSCTISSQRVMWWTKGANYYIPDVTQIINKAEKPLVISDDRTHAKPLVNILGDVMSLSHRLDSKVHLQLVVEPTRPKIPDGFSDIFLFKPSESLRHGLENQHYKLETLYKTQDSSPVFILGKLEM